MSEINKSYRIRTDIGQKKSNDFITIDASLVQDYETFDILSVKISSVDTYKLHNANYGVVVGRVLANNGFGVPNAKISVFIEADSDDGEKVRDLYPFMSPTYKDRKGVRYNLLPDEKVNDCHSIVGTFPNKRYALDNDIILEVFEKYYKYTTRTNNSGDYMIMGVPVGNHTLHMDLDLSDCGILSQRPRDFVYKGYTVEQFENPNKFKDGNLYSNLSQIFSQDQVVNVRPFWGNNSLGEELGITRADIDVAFKFEPTCVFIGSVVSDNSSQGITKKCMATENMGYMEEMTTGEGTIEMIRKTPGGSIEEFQIRGTQLIDGNGVWCYQIPMNLDYMMTDEYGNMVPTDDPEKGIPTRTQVRFRMSMQDNEENVDNFFRAKVLVPHNPQNLENGLYEEYDYEFGSMTRDDSFRDLFWNNVYSVKSYIPRFQKRKIRGWRDNKFTGFKSCNFYGSNNPMPYNNIRIKLPFMFTIMCALVKILIFLVSVQNTVIALLGNGLADIGNTKIPIIKKYPFKHLYRKATELSMNVLKEGLCPDLENWFFAPMFKDKLWTGAKPPRGMERYDLLKQTLEKIDESSADDDTTSIDVQNDEEKDNEEPICLTIYTDYLISCIEMNLAMEYKVINFDFYNDWVNGVLYFPRFMRYLRPKKTFLGITFARAKIKGCMDDTKIFSKTRRYTQQCSMGVKNNPNPNGDTFTNVNASFLGTKSQKKIREVNNFHKKRGFTQKTIFGKNGGICHEATTSKGHHVYYMKPCEWTRGTTPNSKKVNLFATDIILLGSLNDCDLHGVPQAFKYLSSTSYILPTNLALTNMDTNGYLYATEKGTICAGKSTLTIEEIENAKSGVTISTHSGLSGEILYYSGAQDTNIDVMYDGVELSDIIALTEAAGISWNYTGPGQGKIDDSRMYYPGGHFLGLSCANSQTNIKSCINLTRVCEVGANISQRKEDVFKIDNKGNISYKYITPSGFISGDDIVGANFRTMFATLNQNRLIATKINPNTGYKMYDFKYINPINFNGAFKNIVDEKTNLYNKKIDVPEEDINIFKQAGIDTNPNNREDFDVNEISNTQTRTIEDTSLDYYLFRFGLDYKELKKNNQKHLRKFLLSDGGYQYLPQYENSYYFYFGLKNGVTAIDEFNKQFFSECENGILLSDEPLLNISIYGDISICDAKPDINITTTNLETPFQFIEIKLDGEVIKRVTDENDKDEWLSKYSFVYSDDNLRIGTYTVTIRDANDNEITSTTKIGNDLVSFSSIAYDFNYDTSTHPNGYIGDTLHQGGYIEIFDMEMPKLLEKSNEETKKVELIIKDSDDNLILSGITYVLGESSSVTLPLKRSGEYSLYVKYQCEGNTKPVELPMQQFSIKDGSSVGLKMGAPGIIEKKLSVEDYGAHTGWWRKTNEMNSNNKWLERVCLFNEITKDKKGTETMSSRIFAENGTKCIWGPPQNSDGITNGVFFSEDYTSIPNGFIVDDENIYYPTKSEHYSALAYKNTTVMGNYYAWLSNEDGDVKVKGDVNKFVDGYGYIFKPLPEGDLQFHIKKEGKLSWDSENDSIKNGVFYPSIAFPIFDKEFYAKATFYVWQDRHVALEVGDDGEEKPTVVDKEMSGRAEIEIHNGVTFYNDVTHNSEFFNDSFIDNFTNDAFKKLIKSNDDMITPERVISGYSFYGGSIESAITDVYNFGYSIKGGAPDETSSQLCNVISNDISNEFPDYALYRIKDNQYIGPSFENAEEMGYVVDYFLCKQPKSATTDNVILEDDGVMYYDDGDLYIACTYTSSAVYNNEGTSLLAAVKDPWLGKTSVSFDLKQEDGTIKREKRKLDYKGSNPKDLFQKLTESVPEILPIRKYKVVDKNSRRWKDIIASHRQSFDFDKDNGQGGIVYAVAVIANIIDEKTKNYSDDIMVYKIFPNIVKVSKFKLPEVFDVKVEPSIIEAPYSESTYTVKVTGGSTSWTASTLSDWITVQPINGLETTDVTITLKENNENGDREGVVNFIGNSSDDSCNCTLMVRQSQAIDGKAKEITLSNQSPVSCSVELDSSNKEEFSGSEILTYFGGEISNTTTSVTLRPPAVKVEYFFKNEVEGGVDDVISKEMDVTLTMSLYSSINNTHIDSKGVNVSFYNGSTVSFDDIVFNPKSYGNSYYLELKWAVTVGEIDDNLINGVILKGTFQPSPKFLISEKE